MTTRRHISWVNPTTRRPWQLLLLASLLIPCRAADAIPWVPLQDPTPGAVNGGKAPASVAHMLLLSDGTVIAQSAGGNAWYRLTPDIHGSYISGSWTTMASMTDTRTFYSSQVLMDGRVFVAGNEYGTGGGGTVEIFN